ncbi:Eco57I restriction-modification methylase domain-containing protein, partial [Staphylococcus pseudintermedius]|nr:Eco57I restriction-modification methylase domain-containing protein [Staphylococcus pseudintermedius]
LNQTPIDLEAFEKFMYFDFDKVDTKNFGITFTPTNVVNLLFDETIGEDFKKYSQKKVLDPSIGTGNFFIKFLIKQKELDKNFSLVEFIENNLYGYDIKIENIFFCKLNLILLCLIFDEDVEDLKFNIFHSDIILEYLNGTLETNFDLIIGNPPYVKQQNIKENYREILKRNFDTIYSNYNLYYSFIELSTKLLNENGRIIFLVPNYILKIKSAQYLRELLIKDNWIEKIIDFETNKIFSGIDTYTMILSMKKNSDTTFFKIIQDPNKPIDEIDWKAKKINFNHLNSIDLVSEHEEKLIKAVTTKPNKLIINTGIATLKDKIYLIDHVDEKGNFYKIYKGSKYPIEKNIVKQIIKGSGQSKKNIIKKQYIIYPYYVNDQNKVSLIDHKNLKKYYPYTENFFNQVKTELLTRSGNYQDDDWYKYGRSQSLNKFQPKIIFPTNTDKPKFKYFPENALFYNGYAIFGIENHKNNEKLFIALCLILNSDIISEFMRLTSYYIGGGYISYQKKYLSRVKLPNLTEKEINLLVSVRDDKAEINRLVQRLYFE